MSTLLHKLTAAAILLAATAIVPACSTTDARQTVFALDSTYAAAATAEAGYCKLPVADASVCAQMKQYDNEAYNALSPLTVAASQPGATIDSVALTAAEIAVTKFASLATAHKVSK